MTSTDDNYKHHQNKNREYKNRPADTKYTPATDPKKFFDNQFHTADRFFDLSGAEMGTGIREYLNKKY